KDLPFEVRSLAEYPDVGDVEETGTSFSENACLKALTIASRIGELTLADDSGLEVDALGGAPGVYSARFAGMAGRRASDAENNALLLERLQGIPEEKRTARFVCAVAIA